MTTGQKIIAVAFVATAALTIRPPHNAAVEFCALILGFALGAAWMKADDLCDGHSATTWPSA